DIEFSRCIAKIYVRSLSKDFIEKTTELSEEEKKKILGENARVFYGFEELEVPEKIRNMVE
ncbi:MAG: hypothetical protein ACOCN3_03475, partial [Roseburia inulinivorans]